MGQDQLSDFGALFIPKQDKWKTLGQESQQISLPPSSQMLHNVSLLESPDVESPDSESSSNCEEEEEGDEEGSNEEEDDDDEDEDEDEEDAEWSESDESGIDVCFLLVALFLLLT